MTEYLPVDTTPFAEMQKSRLAENEARSAAKFKWVMGSTDLYECPECAALVAGGGWRGHYDWHLKLLAGAI